MPIFSKETRVLFTQEVIMLWLHLLISKKEDFGPYSSISIQQKIIEISRLLQHLSAESVSQKSLNVIKTDENQADIKSQIMGILPTAQGDEKHFSHEQMEELVEGLDEANLGMLLKIFQDFTQNREVNVTIDSDSVESRLAALLTGIGLDQHATVTGTKVQRQVVKFSNTEENLKKTWHQFLEESPSSVLTKFLEMVRDKSMTPGLKIEALKTVEALCLSMLGLPKELRLSSAGRLLEVLTKDVAYLNSFRPHL